MFSLSKKLLLLLFIFAFSSLSFAKMKDHKNFKACTDENIKATFLGEVVSKKENSSIENDMLLVPIRCEEYECNPFSEKYSNLNFTVYNLKDQKTKLETFVYCRNNEIEAYAKVLFELLAGEIVSDGKKLLYAYEKKYSLGRLIGENQFSGMKYQFFNIGKFSKKYMHVVQISEARGEGKNRKVLAFYIKPSFYEVLQKDLKQIKLDKLFKGRKKPSEKKKEGPKVDTEALID